MSARTMINFLEYNSHVEATTSLDMKPSYEQSTNSKSTVGCQQNPACLLWWPRSYSDEVHWREEKDQPSRDHER